MKYDLWFKSGYPDAPLYHCSHATEGANSLHVSTELPGNLAKSGYHLVLSENDPPKREELLPAVPAFPKILQELGSSEIYPDILPLQRAVGQLLALGYAGNEQSQFLLKHLKTLAQEFYNIRRELHGIPADKLRLADELVAARK